MHAFRIINLFARFCKLGAKTLKDKAQFQLAELASVTMPRRKEDVEMT